MLCSKVALNLCTQRGLTQFYGLKPLTFLVPRVQPHLTEVLTGQNLPKKVEIWNPLSSWCPNTHPWLISYTQNQSRITPSHFVSAMAKKIEKKIRQKNNFSPRQIRPSKCHFHHLQRLCKIFRTGVNFCCEHAVFCLKLSVLYFFCIIFV